MIRGAVGVVRLDGQVSVHTGPRVFECDGLLGVDSPAGHPREERLGGRVGEDVVEGSRAPRVNVGGLARAGHVRPARSFEDLDRVLLGVGVEVADEQGRLVRKAGGEGCQRLGLCDADRVRVALPITVVDVTLARALGDGTLRLEVVGDDHEGCGCGSLGGDTHELLSNRLARQARERRVVVNERLTDGGDGRGLVDEGDADDVLGLGNGLGRGHVRPGPRSRCLVEGLDKARQGCVAVRSHAHGHRVFDLLQGDHVGPQGVDR